MRSGLDPRKACVVIEHIGQQTIAMKTFSSLSSRFALYLVHAYVLNGLEKRIQHITGFTQA